MVQGIRCKIFPTEWRSTHSGRSQSSSQVALEQPRWFISWPFNDCQWNRAVSITCTLLLTKIQTWQSLAMFFSRYGGTIPQSMTLFIWAQGFSRRSSCLRVLWILWGNLKHSTSEFHCWSWMEQVQIWQWSRSCSASREYLGMIAPMMTATGFPPTLPTHSVGTNCSSWSVLPTRYKSTELWYLW